MTAPEEPEPLRDEATRLVGALQQWLGGAHRQGEVTDDVWSRATAEGGEPGNAPECAFCPICRSIRFVREIDPDTVERFADAATAMVAALQDSRRRADPPQRGPYDPPADDQT